MGQKKIGQKISDEKWTTKSDKTTDRKLDKRNKTKLDKKIG